MGEWRGLCTGQNQPVISGCVNHYMFATLDWHWGATQTVNLKLEKGWNNVLFKRCGSAIKAGS